MKHIHDYKGFLNESGFHGPTNRVTETAKRTKFTGKTAHDLYTQLEGKSKMVFVKNDWYSVDPSELKDDKGEWFTGYTKDGSDYEFHVKDIGFIQESVNEGFFKEDDLDHEVRSILTSDGESMNAKHITSELPNKGFDRGVSVRQVEASLDRLIKKGIVRLINSAGKKEFIIESVNEAASINKIQSDWTKVTNDMKKEVELWKAADVKDKEKHLKHLKDLTAKKRDLEDALNKAVELQDVDAELMEEKLNVDTVAKKWDELYGEDFKDDYYDIWKKLKAKGSFTLGDLEKMWDKAYGEEFKDQYDGLYKELMNESAQSKKDHEVAVKLLAKLIKENPAKFKQLKDKLGKDFGTEDIEELMNESLITEGKTDAIYNFVKAIYDAGTEFDRHSFGTYWKEHQGKIIADFNKI